MGLRREESGLRSETVRRANLSAIASELHASGALSRSELGVHTGLTRSAIRALIGEFVAADFANEERAMPLGTPGRPSVVVTPSADRAVALGLEIEVDSIAAVVLGFGGRVLEQARVDRPRGQPTVDQVVGDVADLAGEIGGLPPERANVVGIGVAVAGVVRRTDGLVSLAPNLGWRDVPLGEALRHRLGTDVPIAVANEADLGALAETSRGAARGSQHVVYVSGEVGVGGGLIIDGRPYAGVAGYGGEIGHMPLNPEGEACSCGATGCWETEIGEEALLARAGHPRAGGREAVDAVLRDATAGSPAALAALEHVGLWLGRGLAGLVNALNPELVVLGGLFSRIHPFVEALIELELDRLALDAPRRMVAVVPASLGEDSALLGAAELAFDDFLSDPAEWLGPREAAVAMASA